MGGPSCSSWVIYLGRMIIGVGNIEQIPAWGHFDPTTPTRAGLTVPDSLLALIKLQVGTLGHAKGSGRGSDKWGQDNF